MGEDKASISNHRLIVRLRVLSIDKMLKWSLAVSIGPLCPMIFGSKDAGFLPGMHRTCTLIEDDGLWFEGSDGSQLFVSVRLGREWIVRELRPSDVRSEANLLSMRKS